MGNSALILESSGSNLAPLWTRHGQVCSLARLLTNWSIVLCLYAYTCSFAHLFVICFYARSHVCLFTVPFMPLIHCGSGHAMPKSVHAELACTSELAQARLQGTDQDVWHKCNTMTQRGITNRDHSGDGSL